MNNKIKFGIIGCSSFAERITIPSIKESKTAKLEIVGSRSIKKAKKVAKNFSCKAYGNYDEVLENDEINSVYISLPIALQKNLIIKSAKAGKHILCEKSAVTSFDSAKKVVEECKKNSVRLMENFGFRYHPQHDYVLKLIQKNVLGEIFSFSGKFGFQLPYSSKNFRFNKKLGGGILNDVGCYLISASRMLFQTEPTSVTCNLIQDRKSKIDINGS